VSNSYQLSPVHTLIRSVKTEKDKQPETKEIDKFETNNEAGSKKNLLPYQTVTQKVRVMFDRTILADPVQTKRVKCHHLNCEHQMDQIEYLPNC
jgi:hypothetical protein